jgi:hypothetical protein
MAIAASGVVAMCVQTLDATGHARNYVYDDPQCIFQRSLRGDFRKATGCAVSASKLTMLQGGTADLAVID